MFEPVGHDRMQLTKPLTVLIVNQPGVQFVVSIEAGYSFDGASIPRVFWSLIGGPFDPDFQVASCIHDKLCELSVDQRDYQIRVVGDAAFFALLSRRKIARWRLVAMYLAVRLNSWWRYGRTAR